MKIPRINKETNIFNKNAIANGIATATTKATNFITELANGIFVHAEGTPSDPTASTAAGVNITDDVDIIRNGESVAQFGENTQIGKDEEAHIVIDYRSLRQYAYEPEWGISDQYFYVGDFRDKDNDNLAQMHDLFVMSGTENFCTLSSEAVDTNYTVTVEGDTSGAVYKKDTTGISFYSDTSYSHTVCPSAGTKVYIDYTTDGAGAKAFTFGGRVGNNLGGYSASFGRINGVSGYCAFGNGEDIRAYGSHCHAEGYKSKAYGAASHAEGWGSQALGRYSHAEGWFSEANGVASHACGYEVIANGLGQTAIGTYNIANNSHLFIVGNGNIATEVRSNALTVDNYGNEVIAGTLTQSSDRRLKDHIDYLDEDAVEFVRGLKPAHYIKDDEHHVGFYAQDVEEIDKWGCMTGEMNGYKTLGYTEIIAPLVKYCQCLEARIVELEKDKEN